MANSISTIKILMYHRLVETKPTDNVSWHYVSVDDFRKQMTILQALNYTPITFDDYRLYLDGNLALPKKPIIITFDDGYLDTYELAIPIMVEFGIRAVLFVLGNRKLNWASWDESSIESECPLMTDEQIIHAHSMGFEIGSHSMNHYPLSKLSDDEVRKEVGNSKRSIESLVGKPIHSFSYSYGMVDERISNIVEDAGFRFGCGVFTGPPAFAENLFDFRRIAIRHQIGTVGFMMRLITPYQYVEWMYSKTRQLGHRSATVIEARFQPNMKYKSAAH